jgi:hypothetical protein
VQKHGQELIVTRYSKNSIKNKYLGFISMHSRPVRGNNGLSAFSSMSRGTPPESLLQLGKDDILLRQFNTVVIFHNTLAASEFGLIDQTTLEPRSNYWAALLWRRLATPGLNLTSKAAVHAASAPNVIVLTNSHQSVSATIPKNQHRPLAVQEATSAPGSRCVAPPDSQVRRRGASPSPGQRWPMIRSGVESPCRVGSRRSASTTSRIAPVSLSSR